jgi:hypothetical protein
LLGLGHGFCTYTFFEQCPHRMACARCDFYPRKPRPRDNCWRPKTTCNACSPASRSPTTNEQPSMTVRPPSTNSWNDLSIPPPRPAQHP